MINPTAGADLFFPGHKTYGLIIKPPKPETVYLKKFQCPFCLNNFEKEVPRQSNMHPVKTDADLRVHYNNIEPLYFEIVTCPSCNISAVAALFEKAGGANETELFEALSPYRGKFNFSDKIITDLNTMFAGFYLAAVCAPVCFPHSDMIEARIWHRLSWLYGDCGDTALSGETEKKALDLYVKVYQNVDHADEQIIRVQLIIAELSFRRRDFKTASEFFMRIKTTQNAGAVYQQLAGDRIEEIRNR